ncbi:MAG: protease inhibitor I42 family protein [Spirochaetota bacterium]
MMNNTINKVLIFLAVLIMIVDCSKVMDTQCILIDAQKYAGEPITVKINECITIEIESQLSTGYRWRFAIKENPGVLINSDYKVHTGEGQTVGGIDKEIFTFKAVKAGKSTVVFDYIRPFDKNPKPVKTKEFNITIME